MGRCIGAGQQLVLAAAALAGIPAAHCFVPAGFGGNLALRYRPASPARTSMSGAIVGKGRIGEALHAMGRGQDVLVGRQDTIPEGTGPIYVCTRNDDLQNVISRTPASRREDLVFLQNGVLEELLEENGLQDNTQALIYFAVAKRGEKPIDGVTDANPEGLTSVTGKWAEDFKGRLESGGLTCHVMDKDRYTARMYEKHIWICAFMLLGIVHDCNIGAVEAEHTKEVRELINELVSAVSKAKGVTFEDGVEDRLCAYSRSVAHYPAALKEFEWRNGWFWELSKEAVGRDDPDPCPKHTAFLVNLNIYP